MTWQRDVSGETISFLVSEPRDYLVLGPIAREMAKRQMRVEAEEITMSFRLSRWMPIAVSCELGDLAELIDQGWQGLSFLVEDVKRKPAWRMYSSYLHLIDVFFLVGPKSIAEFAGANGNIKRYLVGGIPQLDFVEKRFLPKSNREGEFFMPDGITTQRIVDMILNTAATGSIKQI